ncbi:MAG: diguanylate cyclase [Firmicutes bacterium]|nr:diguanylate cyclase [Bacillota bacterium]
MFKPIINNMFLIISFMYITIKLKNIIIIKTKNKSIIKRLTPLAYSILSILIMQYPLSYKGIIFDLRTVPIFLVSYRLGFKAGILTSILPIIYRLFLGGSTTLQGVLLGILLPSILGSFFYRKEKTNHLIAKITIKKLLLTFLSFHFVHKFLLLITLDITIGFWFKISSIMILTSTISILCIALMINDDRENINLHKGLKYLSNHDYLTTLPNLRYFKSKVNNLLENDVPLVIAMLDIDYFKIYNDTNGHPAGDEVLRSLAQLLKDNTRTNMRRYKDYIARYGGEEFIICFSDINNIDFSYKLAERIRKSIENYPFKKEDSQPMDTLTVSIGLSTISYKKDLDKLIKEADKALYVSKSNGKNCVSIFNEDTLPKNT